MADLHVHHRLGAVVRAVQSRADVPQAADEIVSAARDLIPNCFGAGLTLVSRGHSIESVGVSDDVVREGDALQYELGEGPCLDAAWEEEQVYSDDIRRDERWPRWAPRIAELGVGSMLCTRLFTNDDHLGALNLYGDQAYGFDEEDAEIARLLAAHAAVAVAAAQEIATLRVAVDRRTTIGKALGIIMARYGLDDDKAMSVLRRLSSHQNRKLYDIAVDVVREVRIPTEDL
jgi:GAF domain-containing protein